MREYLKNIWTKNSNYISLLREMTKRFLHPVQFDKLYQEAILQKLGIEDFMKLILSKSQCSQNTIDTFLSILSKNFEADEADIFSKFQNTMKNDYLIGCITHNGYSKDMWGKYAVDFTGICIEYDITPIIRDCFPVYYYPDCPDFLHIVNNLLFRYAICRKLLKWEFEQEMRIIKDVQNGNYLPLEAKAITITEKCIRPDEVSALAKQKGIPLYIISSTKDVS